MPYHSFLYLSKTWGNNMTAPVSSTVDFTGQDKRGERRSIYLDKTDTLILE